MSKLALTLFLLMTSLTCRAGYGPLSPSEELENALKGNEPYARIEFKLPPQFIATKATVDLNQDPKAKTNFAKELFNLLKNPEDGYPLNSSDLAQLIKEYAEQGTQDGTSMSQITYGALLEKLGNQHYEILALTASVQALNLATHETPDDLNNARFFRAYVLTRDAIRPDFTTRTNYALEPSQFKAYPDMTQQLNEAKSLAHEASKSTLFWRPEKVNFLIQMINRHLQAQAEIFKQLMRFPPRIFDIEEAEFSI